MVPGTVLIYFLVHRMVVRTYVTHVFIVERGLSVLRPNQAFVDNVKRSNMYASQFPILLFFAIFQKHRRTGGVCTEAQGSRRGIIDARRHHQYVVQLVCLKDFYSEGTHRRRRCPVSIHLSICSKEGKQGVFLVFRSNWTTLHLLRASLYLRSTTH